MALQKPDQSTLVDCSVSHGAGRSCDLPALPVAGVYTVLVDPSAAAATLKLWLSADVTGTVAINSAATAVSAPFGRDGRYTFTGTAGQALGLGITEPVTTPPNGYVSITVQKPDQSILLDCSVWHGAGTSCDLPVLPVTGVYTIVVDPGFATATLKLWLSTDVAGALTADGVATTFTTARAGQNARYTFAGTAGQDLRLVLSGDTFPGDTEVYVYEPNGNLWTWTSLFYASGSGSAGLLDLWGLPATGTYTVFITPTGIATGSITTRLVTP